MKNNTDGGGRGWHAHIDDGGVDGMQIDIDIRVYCADKKLEVSTKDVKEKTESRSQCTQTETVSSISK